MTAVGDPDQNIYAWRGAASTTCSSSRSGSLGRTARRPPAPPVHELPLRGPDPRPPPTRSSRRIPDAQRPDPDKELRARSGQRRGRGHGRPAPGRMDRGSFDRRRAWWRCTRTAPRGPASRCCAATSAPVRSAAAGVRRARRAGRDRRARGAPEAARGGGGARVRASGRTTRRRRVALARILLGPRYRVGFKDLALVARLATTGIEAELEYMTEDDVEADAVPVRRGARAPG